MFKALFDMILNLIASLVQIVLYPLNLAIENLMPDLSDKIILFTNNVGSIFGNFAWILDILPAAVFEVVCFILTVEIAKYSIYIAIHAIPKIWRLIQLLKFW